MNNWICPKCESEHVNCITVPVGTRKCLSCNHEWNRFNTPIPSVKENIRQRAIIDINIAIESLNRIGIKCSFDESTLTVK